MLTLRKHLSWPFLLIVICFVAGLGLVPMVVAQQPSQTPTPATSNEPQTVDQYGLFELSFEVPGNYTNPYDPEQIAVNAAFHAPDGAVMTVPGFFMQPFQQTCTADNCQSEALEPAGEAGWFVRFSPPQAGLWTYEVTATDSSGFTPVARGTVTVVASENPGYIGVGDNAHYFAFENGTPYFPIGENLAWSWEQGGGIFAYERWLDELSAVGANYARVNIDVPWFIGLDWPGPAGDYSEAQQAAWRLDTLIQMAEERGIYFQLVLVWHQAYTNFEGPPVPVEGPRPDTEINWSSNPLNVDNGGPLTGPSAMFFDPTARTLFQQRLRYAAARWGYSPHVFAWEIVDEADSMIGYTAVRAAAWLDEMAGALRQADAGRHLITAGTNEIVPAVLQLPALDFAQFQFYPPDDAEDMAASFLAGLSQVTAYAGNKPILVPEFSLNPWIAPVSDDPTGVHVINTNWAAALSGSAGGAMTWWWDTYIDRENLYGIYAPLALFSQNIPWNSPHLLPLQAGLVSEDPAVYQAMRFDAFNRDLTVDSPADTIYRLTTEGAVPPVSSLSGYLYGESNPERSHPETFIISPPVDTELRIGIRDVSAAAPAVLAINIDAIEVARVDFSPTSRNILVTVPISAGEHTVVLDNLGEDWLQLDYIEIAHYSAPVRVLALADRVSGIAAAWVQQRGYTWQLVAEEAQLEPLTFQLQFPDMPAGVYRLTYLDTLTGLVIGEENVTLLEPGTLRVNLLPITSQLAVHASRIAGPGTDVTPDVTQVATRTPDISPSPTSTDTGTPTETFTPTATNTKTQTPTVTGTATRTPSATPTDTATETPLPTDTSTRTPSPTITATNTATATRRPTQTRAPTSTRTLTPVTLIPLPEDDDQTALTQTSTP